MSSAASADPARRTRVGSSLSDPPPGAPTGGALLLAACEKLLTDWKGHARGGIASREEVEQALEEICGNVDRLATGRAASGATEPSKPLLHDRLIEALRGEILLS